MRPNFVLIMCDQQLREHLGCYGLTYGVTPNLDRLAAEGLTFENACSDSAGFGIIHVSPSGSGSIL